MLEDPYISWLREGLNAPGKSQTGLAEHLNLHPSAINKVLRGRRKLASSEIAGAEEYLGTPAPSSGITLNTSNLAPVPVIGKTAAGMFMEVDEFDQSQPEMLWEPPDPQFPSARRVAFDVDGDSMNALQPRPILKGDRAICVAYEDVAHLIGLRDKMVVVVQRTRDGGQTREWSIKQVELFNDRVEFHPRTTNPKHKPIVVSIDLTADDGTVVEILALLRRIVSEFPIL